MNDELRIDIIAGDSLELTLSRPSTYPADDGWTGELVMSCATHRIVLVEAIDSLPGTIAFDATPTQTALYQRGEYACALRMLLGDQRAHTIRTGTAIVRAGLGIGETPVDARSYAKRCLDAIDAKLEGRASRDVESFVIDTGNGSHSINYMNNEELLKLRSHFARLVAAENEAAARARGVNTRIIYTRFN